MERICMKKFKDICVELLVDNSYGYTQYNYAVQVSRNGRQVDGFNNDYDCFAYTSKSKKASIIHFESICEQVEWMVGGK